MADIPFDKLEDDHSFKSQSTLLHVIRKPAKAHVVLTILFILLLTLCIVFIALYVREKSDTKSPVPSLNRQDNGTAPPTAPVTSTTSSVTSTTAPVTTTAAPITTTAAPVTTTTAPVTTTAAPITTTAAPVTTTAAPVTTTAAPVTTTAAPVTTTAAPVTTTAAPITTTAASITTTAASVTTTAAPVTTTTASVTTCRTPSCVISAADILQNLDTSVKPCDDFYQYSCGGFIKNHHVEDEGVGDVNPLSIAQKNVKYSLRDLLDNKQLIAQYSKDPKSAVYKAVNYYRSCMNETEIGIAGFQPMLDLIRKYGSWNITTDYWTGDSWTGDSWVLEKILARVFVDLRINVFIQVDIKPYFFNTSQNFISIAPALQPSGYIVKKNNQQVVSSLVSEEDQFSGYNKFMLKIFKLLGAYSSSLAQDVQRISNLESKYVSVRKIITVTDEASLRKNVKLMTLDQLNNLTSFKFNWTAYSEEVLRGTNKSIKPDQKIMIALPNNIKAIIDFITGQPKSLLANTIMWNVVRQFIKILPKSFRDVENEYSRSMGETKVVPRWKTCSDFTTTLLAYPMVLIYANAHLSDDTRQRAADLFFEIKNEFIDGLNEQTWMDNATRTQAQNKLNAMKQTIGYPSFIKDPTKLNKYYRRAYVKPFGFFQNQLNVLKIAVLNKIETLGKPPDNTSGYSLSPFTVNAYYSPRDNAMTVLMGILQKPMYKSDNLKALNYGGIGMIIGHEITHGFDATGSRFDEKGNLRSWWSKESHKHFVERSQCLIKEYSNVTIFGKKVNGNQTLSENIADNGGLKYAFRAYQKWRETHGVEDRLPSLNFTNDQLFFIGFAQSWCTKYTKEGIKSLMEFDTHSLSPVRVRVTLHNFPEFSKAFGCKQSKKTCTVW